MIEQWKGRVGKDLIGIRFFNALLIYLSGLIPILFLKTRVSRLELFFLFSLILIILAPLNANILGFDTFTVFISSVIFTLLVSFIRSLNSLKLVLLAIFYAVAVFIRFPNIILLVIIPVILLIDKYCLGTNFKTYLKQSLVFIFLSFFFVAIGYFLVFYNDPHFGESFLLSGKHHVIDKLLLGYFFDGLTILGYSIFLLLGYFLIKRKGKNVYVSIFVVVLLVAFMITLVIHTKYSRSYSLLLTSLGAVFGITQFFDKKTDNRYRLMLVAFVLFLFVNPFGSNTGLLKSSFLFILFPAILMNTSYNSRRMTVKLLLIMIPFAFIEKVNAVYEDGKIYRLSEMAEHELLQPIKTTPQRKMFLDKMHKEVKKLKHEEVPVYFYGNKSHIFVYLYPGSNLESNSFFQTGEYLLHSDSLQQKIESFDKAAIFIIENYPEKNPQVSLETDQFFLGKGYKKN